MGCLCEHLGENWPRYNASALYIYFMFKGLQLMEIVHENVENWEKQFWMYLSCFSPLRYAYDVSFKYNTHTHIYIYICKLYIHLIFTKTNAELVTNIMVVYMCASIWSVAFVCNIDNKYEQNIFTSGLTQLLLGMEYYLWITHGYELLL